MRVKKNMMGAVTGRGIGGAVSKTTHTRNMQMWTHLQDICNQEHTYKRHAIGIAPIRDMQLELHLQDRCNWNCIYKTDAVRITPTTSKCACTRQMHLGMHPPVFECVVPLCQFLFYVNTMCDLCLNG